LIEIPTLFIIDSVYFYDVVTDWLVDWNSNHSEHLLLCGKSIEYSRRFGNLLYYRSPPVTVTSVWGISYTFPEDMNTTNCRHVVPVLNYTPRHEDVLGEWRYSSTHSLTSTLDGGEWSASRPGRFTLREGAPGTHWIGGWMGSRAGLDAMVTRKIPGTFHSWNVPEKAENIRLNFRTVSGPALESTQPPVLWVPGALSLRIKWQGREADHSPLSSAGVKNAWSYTSIHPICLHCMVLCLKHRDNFTFTFTFIFYVLLRLSSREHNDHSSYNLHLIRHR